jgi:hypothetical protein
MRKPDSARCPDIKREAHSGIAAEAAQAASVATLETPAAALLGCETPGQ